MIESYCQEEGPANLTALWAVLGILGAGAITAVVILIVYYTKFRNEDEIRARAENYA